MPIFGKGTDQPNLAPPPPAPTHPAEEPDHTDPATRILSLDLTGVSTEFVPIPVGLYAAMVDEVEYVPTSKKSGQPGLKWIFTITGKPNDGRKLFYHTSLVPQALWKLAKVLDALGMENVADNPNLQLDLDVMVGLPCTLSVTIGSYQGKPKNEIVDVLPGTTIGAGEPAPF